MAHRVKLLITYARFMKRALECVSAYTSSCVTILSQLLTCKTLLLSNVLFLLTTNTLSNKACVNKSIVYYNMNKKNIVIRSQFFYKTYNTTVTCFIGIIKLDCLYLYSFFTFRQQGDTDFFFHKKV